MNMKIIVAALVAVIVVGFFSAGRAGDLEGISADVYKSQSCGCCKYYAAYLNAKGADATVHNMGDSKLSQLKESLGMPANMQSCHTVKIGNYFVEGHIPKEAVEKLLREKPDIDGIVLPGMPSGSPGMPGPKNGPFIIYGIKDGKASEFMRI